jgi:hypothetical protein
LEPIKILYENLAYVLRTRLGTLNQNGSIIKYRQSYVRDFGKLKLSQQATQSLTHISPNT